MVMVSVTTLTQPLMVSSDRDGDGVPDLEDAFPDNPGETLDTDEDGVKSIIQMMMGMVSMMVLMRSLSIRQSGWTQMATA